MELSQGSLQIGVPWLGAAGEKKRRENDKDFPGFEPVHSSTVHRDARQSDPAPAHAPHAPPGGANGRPLCSQFDDEPGLRRRRRGALCSATTCPKNMAPRLSAERTGEHTHWLCVRAIALDMHPFMSTQLISN